MPTQMHRYAFAFLLLNAVTPCADGPSGGEPSSFFPYDLERPARSWVLPPGLAEISGIAFSGADTLLAVQDEQGSIYQLQVGTGALMGEQPFHKSGDYEDLAVVGTAIWVLKSTGTLYRVEGSKMEKFNTFLEKGADVEGLAYDARENRLLLACKGQSEGCAADCRAVYAFDLAALSLQAAPVLRIEAAALRAYLAAKVPPGDLRAKWEKRLFAAEDGLKFAPSAIAVHPSGDYYISSAAGETLLVLARDGRIKHLAKLDDGRLPQPEGLAFDAAGQLYVSTEAKKDLPASIQVFSPK